jgi:hypothetical protein
MYLPNPVHSLVAGCQVCIQPPSGELREMAKHREIANILGLAAYSVQSPYEKWLEQDPVDLSEENLGALRYQLKRQALVLVSGRLRGEGAELFVCIVVPQSHSHLALGWTELAWPCEDALSHQPDVTLLIWPGEIQGRRGGRLLSAGLSERPETGCLIMTGSDDFRGLVAEIRSHWFNRSGRGKENLNEFCKGRLVIPADPDFPVGGEDLSGSVGTILMGVEVDQEAGIPLFELTRSGRGESTEPGCLVIPGIER